MLQIEWTNQHGCGGNEGNDPHKLNCNVVLQYFMPQTFTTQEGQRVGGQCAVCSGLGMLRSVTLLARLGDGLECFSLIIMNMIVCHKESVVPHICHCGMISHVIFFPM